MPDPLNNLRFDEVPQHRFHAQLNAFNRKRLSPSLPARDWKAGFDHATDMAKSEYEFIESERRSVAKQAASAPATPSVSSIGSSP